MSVIKEFETYNIRCRCCGVGKPKDEFKNSYRKYCKECIKAKKP